MFFALSSPPSSHPFFSVSGTENMILLRFSCRGAVWKSGAKERQPGPQPALAYVRGGGRGCAPCPASHCLPCRTQSPLRSSWKLFPTTHLLVSLLLPQWAALTSGSPSIFLLQGVLTDLFPTLSFQGLLHLTALFKVGWGP